MDTKRASGRLIAMLFVFAGLLFLLTPASRAQAQENIATINTQDNGQATPAPDMNVPDNTGIAPAPDDSQDPPTRVARISDLDGSVSLQPGGTGDWGVAAKNRPVTIGDKLWTDQGSRLELQAGAASIHLGSMTALSFLNLNQQIIQMRMAEGHINFRVRELRQGDTYEIDTPNLAFTVTEAGAFRVDVNENGDYSSVTIIRGKGEISAAGQNYPLTAGQRGDVSGTDQNVKYIPGTSSEPDDLDRWAQERDLKEDNSVSAQHVSRDTVGYSDLDDYGTWKEEPEVGSVWVPNNVPPDWAPYSNGNWSYISPWGWTWVDASPWGFAPYHYGRWNYYGGSWGWCPGPIWAPPVYGPAFVGFVGGFGFGVGFGFGGGYGWFPLGWGEPYHPWYHCGGAYWNHINAYNTHFNNYNNEQLPQLQLSLCPQRTRGHRCFAQCLRERPGDQPQRFAHFRRFLAQCQGRERYQRPAHERQLSRRFQHAWTNLHALGQRSESQRCRAFHAGPRSLSLAGAHHELAQLCGESRQRASWQFRSRASEHSEHERRPRVATLREPSADCQHAAEFAQHELHQRQRFPSARVFEQQCIAGLESHLERPR